MLRWLHRGTMKRKIFQLIGELKRKEITQEAKELRAIGRDQFQRLIDKGITIPVAY